MIKLISVYRAPFPCVQYCEEIEPGIWVVKNTFYAETWKDLAVYFTGKKVYNEIIKEGIPHGYE